jgi:uncharacterized protein
VRNIEVYNVSRGATLGTHIAVAANPWQRFRGLMGERALADGCGLLIRPCNSIHMFFMRLPLDVLYCGTSGPDGAPVLRLLTGIKPWRVGPIVRGSKFVLELPVGAIERTGTRINDFIRLVDVTA